MNAVFGRVAPFALFLSLSTAAYAQQQQPAPQPQPPPQAQPAPQPPPAPAAQAPAQPGPLPALPSQAPQAPQAGPQPPGAAPGAPQYAPQPAPDQGQEAPPPAAQWTYSYPTGSWVYTSDYGWIWVPNGAEAETADGVPYTYLYTPAYGWTWYVSPWGWGPYHYGIWVRHPWHPVGWRGGWVAHPSVFVHLGGHAGFYRGGGRGGYVVHGGGGHYGGGGHGGGGHGGHR